MVKIGLLALVLVGAVSGVGRAVAQDKALRGNLESLISASGGNRTSGQPGATRALKWLRAKATKIGGWQLEEHVFEPDVDAAIAGYKKDFEIFEKTPHNSPQYKLAKDMTDKLIAYQNSLRGKKGVNLILRKKGTDPARASDVLIVSAHYDTINSRYDTIATPGQSPFGIFPARPAPGADDNGAAVVVLLEMARELKALKPSRDLELVFFDFEEAFFRGSAAYAKELGKRAKHAEIVNMEMIGWDKPKSRLVKLYLRSASKPGAGRDEQIGLVIGAQLAKTGLKPITMKNNFDRSDNWSFWNEHFSGITVSQDWEENFNRKHYHAASDTPDTLDWAYVENIYRGVMNGVVELVK